MTVSCTPESAVASADAGEIARRFVAARREARSLPDYPGVLPISLDQAYERQDAAISLWRDPIVGWKVGRIPDLWLERMGEDRLMGPIFAGNLFAADPSPILLPVIDGGFSAIEAEYIFVLGRDARADQLSWSIEQAADLVAELRVGIELAGSPLATINELGPAVVVSDFGNNAGVVIGPEIPDWRSRRWDDMTCATWIDGDLVGRGGAMTLPGGPLAALAFALQRGARRGRSLRAGMIVSTGAASGIHDIRAGQCGRLVFDESLELHCCAVRAEARA